MEELVLAFSELVTVVAYSVLAAGLTLTGLVVEYAGVTGSGTGMSRLWIMFMGGVIIAFGVLIARDKLLPQFESRNA